MTTVRSNPTSGAKSIQVLPRLCWSHNLLGGASEFGSTRKILGTMGYHVKKYMGPCMCEGGLVGKGGCGLVALPRCPEVAMGCGGIRLASNHKALR